MKKHNFSAGPSILAGEVIENTAKAVLDLNGIGLSVMEISHRGKEFKAIMEETVDLFKELLEIPEGYQVLFLQGGASLQFAMVPYNLMKTKAAYLETGTWAKKAIKEAKFFGDVQVIASASDKNFSYIPKDYAIPSDADYLHITTNNTIFGVEIREDIDSPVPLVADMSSDIFSRPIDISKYGIIYGGAQKNLGPAGVTFVIVKEDILGKSGREIPSMLDYQAHIGAGSMYNTPPCLPIYTCLETLRWLKNLGGLSKMQELNEAKANLIYEEIDRNELFVGTAAKDSRSIMNACFVMNEDYKELESEFLSYTSSRGMVGLKGHRSVGGFRASIYNAMHIDSVRALVETMQEFEGKYKK